MPKGIFPNVSVLKLKLHGYTVGYLAGYQDGRNILTFSEEFKTDSKRPTLSLSTNPSFPLSEKLLSTPWVRKQRLHPIISNMLPEGALRKLISEKLKTHPDNEFRMLSYLGYDLPGALEVEHMNPLDIPIEILLDNSNPIAIDPKISKKAGKFSLAGVQMKFSMNENGERFTLLGNGILGDWIVKTPSILHKDLPLNEYTAMTLASLVGIDIPEIRLVERDKLSNLPSINLPNEKFAFAIKRFDRDGNNRIHMEDFAQVLVKYSHEKYDSANCEQLGRIIYQYSGNAVNDIQQFAKRILVNVLLANGDAHLKNWSLIYLDKVTPTLSPSYDIVTTSVYKEEKEDQALNFGGNKDFYKVSYGTFKTWADKSNIPWRIVKPHIDEVIEKARELWPKALKDLPMNDLHKSKLKKHWKKLHRDFKLGD